MESLSVSKLVETQSKAKSEADKETSSHAHVVRVEVGVCTRSLIIGVGTTSTEHSHRQGGGATEDGVHVLCIPELKVEMVGVELDEFNRLNLSAHRVVRLLHVFLVSVNVWTVAASHFDCLKTI